MVSFSKYPFMYTPEEYASVMYGYAIGLEELFSNSKLLELAVDRVLSSFAKRKKWGEKLSGDELFFSFYIAATLVKQLGTRSAITRFALWEAERAFSYLLEEDVSTIIDIASRLGLKLKILEEPLSITVLKTKKGRTLRWIYEFLVPISSYIRYSTRLRGDPKWKLVNNPIKDGYVYVSRSSLLRLMKEIFYFKIISVIDDINIVPSNINKYVDMLKNKLPKYASRESGLGDEGGRVDYDALPPCIKRIHESLLRGENLSHAERFAYATFMLAIGANIEDLVELFRNLPDFKEKITRYQLEHLAGKRGGGKKYSPYNCENMKSRGLCVAECGVTHPLTYYFSRRKRRPQTRGGRYEASKQNHTPRPKNR